MMHIVRPASHEEERKNTLKEYTILKLFDCFKTLYVYASFFITVLTVYSLILLALPQCNVLL